MSAAGPRRIERRRGAGRFFTPRRVARVAILVALSAVGALIKLPSPTGTVALDSAPAFLAGAAFSPAEGSIVGALGHLLSALTTGFPLGLPVHLLVAAEMAVFVAVFGFLARRVNMGLAIAAGILLNGVAGAAIMIPIGGVGLFAGLVLPLTVGAAINVLIAAAGTRALRAAGLTQEKPVGEEKTGEKPAGLTEEKTGEKPAGLTDDETGEDEETGDEETGQDEETGEEAEFRT